MKIMSYFVQVCKIDVTTKESVEWREENCYPSEPVFVSNQDGTDEDDGTSKSAGSREHLDLHLTYGKK